MEEKDLIKMMELIIAFDKGKLSPAEFHILTNNFFEGINIKEPLRLYRINTITLSELFENLLDLKYGKN